MKHDEKVDSAAVRKRILYVENNWFASKPDYRIVLDGLREHYEVETDFELSESTLQLVRDALETHAFDAIVTHVPCEKTDNVKNYSYRGSLNILHKLRELVDIPIIVYTGAGRPEVLISIESYTCALIKKSENTEKDVQIILSWLEEFWGRLPPVSGKPEAKPELHQENGWTYVDAVLNLNYGMGLRSASEIVRKSMSHEGETRLILDVAGESPQIINSKSVMMILMHSIANGTPIRISVEGTDTEAGKMALQLYSGITSEFSLHMDFDRFE